MPHAVDRFFEVVTGAGPLILLPHDNPDPDAIASAAALKFISERRSDREVFICLAGTVARAENRAMLTYLDIELVPVSEVRFSAPSDVVLIDTQPGRRNNSLPDEILPTAVIDHHPEYADLSAIPFVDLRECGATASILTEYVFDAGLEPDGRVATALFYGIAAETQGLGRDAQAADVRASQRLYPFTNKRRLAKIENARVPAAYFRTVRDAIDRAEVVGKLVICMLDELDYPDLAAEVADLLLRLDEASWSAAVGRHRGRIYVSIRTTEPDANAGEVLRKVLGSNAAGGHSMIAGGSVRPDPSEMETAVARTRDRLVRHLGFADAASSPLIPKG